MMKRILWLLLVTITVAARAQTYTVVAQESQFLTLSFPTGTVWDMGNDNKWSPDQTTTQWTAFTPYYPELAAQLQQPNLFPDPDPNQPKVFRVRQTSVVQLVYVTDRANNNTQSTITVPALAAPAYPPFAFVVGTSYNVTVSNIPPATPNDPLQGVIKVYYGNIVVWSAVCSYQTTLTSVDTPPSLAAVFGCKTLTVPPGQQLPINHNP